MVIAIDLKAFFTAAKFCTHGTIRCIVSEYLLSGHVLQEAPIPNASKFVGKKLLYL